MGGSIDIGYYESDFDYITKDWTVVVEDTKNPSTRKAPYYRLKRRLFKAYYGFDITEVMSDSAEARRERKELKNEPAANRNKRSKSEVL